MEILSSRTIVRVRDLGASRRFYEDTIGLQIYREYGAGGLTTGVVFFLGGGFLELTEGGTGVPPGVCLWLQVADVIAEEQRLAAAGVPIRKAAERMPWGLIEAWVEDLDGLEVRLIEVPPDHPLRRRVD